MNFNELLENEVDEVLATIDLFTQRKSYIKLLFTICLAFDSIPTLESLFPLELIRTCYSDVSFERDIKQFASTFEELRRKYKKELKVENAPDTNETTRYA